MNVSPVLVALLARMERRVVMVVGVWVRSGDGGWLYMASNSKKKKEENTNRRSRPKYHGLDLC